MFSSFIEDAHEAAAFAHHISGELGFSSKHWKHACLPYDVLGADFWLGNAFGFGVMF